MSKIGLVGNFTLEFHNESWKLFQKISVLEMHAILVSWSLMCHLICSPSSLSYGLIFWKMQRQKSKKSRSRLFVLPYYYAKQGPCQEFESMSSACASGTKSCMPNRSQQFFCCEHAR